MFDNDRYNNILVDEVILGVFIVLNIINLGADELEKKCLVDDDDNLLVLSKDIIIFTLSITLLIYIYFLINNYNDYRNNIDSDDSYVFEIRYIGSILVVLGLGCFLYFRIKKRGNTNNDIEGMF